MTTSAVAADPQQIAKEWNARGFLCVERTDVSGHELRGCVHETDELFMVLEGAIELDMNGETHTPAPGEELVVPAGTKHTVRNAGTGESRWLHGRWMDFAQTD